MDGKDAASKLSRAKIPVNQDRSSMDQRTHDSPSNSLCVRYGLQLETVLQSGHAVRAGDGADCDYQLIVPKVI